MVTRTNQTKLCDCKVLCPRIILHMWPVMAGSPTTTVIWLILEIVFHQKSLAIGLHLKSELQTPYVTDFGWLPNFGPFQRVPPGLFPHGRANKPNKSHFTHETESPWPLHFKRSHWWKRWSRSKFASHYAWGTNGVCEYKTGVKSTWIPTRHRTDHVSWSLGLFSETTSWR